MADIAPNLTQLAEWINTEHVSALTDARAALEHAGRAGELLAGAKAQCQHGQWLPWLKANVSFSERTAQAYMRVAKRWPELEAKAQATADLTIEEGLKLLAAPKEALDYDATLAEAVSLLRAAVESFAFSGPYTVEELQAIIGLADECERRAHAIKIDNLTLLGEVLRSEQTTEAVQ